MNSASSVLVFGLLFAGPAFAGPPAASPQASVSPSPDLQRLFDYDIAASRASVRDAPAAKSQTLGNPASVVREVNDQNAQAASMQSCALVKKDLPEHRQIDLFVAPVPLSHVQAGFPIGLYRF